MEIFQGDTANWIEEQIPSDASAVTIWLRSRGPGDGLQLVAVQSADGSWKAELSPAVTAEMTPGEWEFQTVAVVNQHTQTVRRGQILIRRGLQFSGIAKPFDDRSQAEIDLSEVEKAIRLLASEDGPQSYEITGGGTTRRVTRADLAELIRWRDRLAALVTIERRRKGSRSSRVLITFS